MYFQPGGLHFGQTGAAGEINGQVTYLHTTIKARALYGSHTAAAQGTNGQPKHVYIGLMTSKRPVIGCRVIYRSAIQIDTINLALNIRAAQQLP